MSASSPPASSPQASQSIHLVLCEGGKRVARYSSLSAATQHHNLVEPSATCKLSTAPFQAELHRAADSPPGEALQPAFVSYGGDPSGVEDSRKAASSLLRTAVQKAVRRRQGLAAAALAGQYFRQLSMPGAKGVNAERAAFCKRLFVVAAEDSMLVSLLGAAGWHALAATKGMGFGVNDARVVAECAGRLAEVGRGLGGGVGGEDGGGGEGEEVLKLFVAEIAQGERGSAERRWLKEVGERRVEEGELGTNVKEEARRAVQETHYKLQDSACLHWAIDHHVKSGSQKSRHATLLKNLRSLCPLLEPIPDAKIDKVVKFEALFNDRDEGVCNVKSCAKPMPKAYATESWEAAVLLNWPAAVAEMWEPLATSSSSSSSVSVKKQKSVADFFGKPSKKPKL